MGKPELDTSVSSGLAWYKTEFCVGCPLQDDPCTAGSNLELHCILANTLREITLKNQTEE